MYDAPGLRLLMEAFGPGYSYTVNSLESPAGMFISDAAAAAVADSELALEKAQATRGALVLQPNEPDLYGYVTEWRDAISAFEQGKDAMLNFDYGRKITMLVMAAYMAHEKKMTIDLTDSEVLQSLENYVPMIQQGINAAGANDRVEVAAGTYNEALIMRDGVDVIGAGADVTTIDATGRGGRPVSFVGVRFNPRLEGFTITGGVGDISGTVGGVPVTIGGGILIAGSSPYITNNVITGNNVTEGFCRGGGIYVDSFRHSRTR